MTPSPSSPDRKGFGYERPGAAPQGSERGLLLVAVRVDHPAEVRRRIETVLAVAATYDRPPDTEAAVWCKQQGELVAGDLDALAYLIGWDATRRLNVGDVVSEAKRG